MAATGINGHMPSLHHLSFPKSQKEQPVHAFWLGDSAVSGHDKVEVGSEFVCG